MMDRQEVEARRDALVHRCQHGVARARDQFSSYAGPVLECTCCRSRFGTLAHPKPITCPGCTQ